MLCLGKKLGPILWQLPPNLRYDRERLAKFFDLLPRDTSAAVKLARQHDERVTGRAAMTTDKTRPIRHALEARHPSFETEEFVNLLREHDVALVIADTAGKWPFLEDITSDFIYVRLHGDEELYVSGYTDSALEEWARKVRSWSKGSTPARTQRIATPVPAARDGRDVFVYFDNDVKVHAPFDARSLAHRLGVGPEPGVVTPSSAVTETARRAWPGRL